jgi:hypothetical protein
MISIIFNNNKTGDERNSFNLQLEEFRQDVVRVRAKNISFLEGRINKVSESQDIYQNSTASKLSILEQRISKMEVEDKKSSRVIQTNVNNWTQNGNSIPATQ